MTDTIEKKVERGEWGQFSCSKVVPEGKDLGATALHHGMSSDDWWRRGDIVFFDKAKAPNLADIEWQDAMPDPILEFADDLKTLRDVDLSKLVSLNDSQVLKLAHCVQYLLKQDARVLKL